MITYLKRDITTVERGIIAHGCNCNGGFGSGVAGAIRKKWPNVYDEFKKMPIGKEILGTMQLVPITNDGTLFVANCFTQEFFGSIGRYADPIAIQTSLHAAFRQADYYGLPIYLPKIGAGLGGLNWESEVFPIVELEDTIWISVETFICIL